MGHWSITLWACVLPTLSLFNDNLCADLFQELGGFIKYDDDIMLGR